MGHRAHYVIVQDGSWDLFYSHWGASELDLDLLPGPDFALRFIRSQHHLTGRDRVWTNELMCEAAAIVAPDERRLGFYTIAHGGLAVRAAVLEVLGLTWPGWQVDWLYQGLPDIILALGEDLSQVHADLHPCRQALQPVGDYRSCLVTVAQGGGCQAYALANVPFEVIGRGESLLAELPEAARTGEVALTPDSGVHFDLDKRAAVAWSIDPLYRVFDWPTTSWPGWTWRFLADDHTVQLDLAGDAVAVPALDRSAALIKLQDRLGRHTRDNPAGEAFRTLPSPYAECHDSPSYAR
ncbi:hypothetical protein [Nonomuraea sp. NPDC002799]